MAKAIVQIIDECGIPQLVEQCKDEIKKYIKELVDVNFTKDISVLIRIVDLPEDKLSIGDKEKNLADMYREQKRYVIRLDRKVLEDLSSGNIYTMYLSIYHEIAHVLDAESYLNSKYAKINPFCKSQKSYENYVAWVGWKFWTEFNAYSMSYNKFGEWEALPEFSSIYTWWMYLEERFPIVQEKMYNQTDDAYECLNAFINDIWALVYAFAKYFGGLVEGKKTHYTPPNNPEENEAYRKMMKIASGFCSRLEKLDTNTYGKGMHKKLVMLGDYIIVKFMLPFYIYPDYECGKICLSMLCDY